MLAKAVGMSMGLWLIDVTNPASPRPRSVWASSLGDNVRRCVRGPVRLDVIGHMGPTNNTTPCSGVLSVDDLDVPSLPCRVLRNDSPHTPGREIADDREDGFVDFFDFDQFCRAVRAGAPKKFDPGTREGRNGLPAARHGMP